MDSQKICGKLRSDLNLIKILYDLIDFMDAEVMCLSSSDAARCPT